MTKKKFIPFLQQRKHCRRWANTSSGWWVCQVTNSGVEMTPILSLLSLHAGTCWLVRHPISPSGLHTRPVAHQCWASVLPNAKAFWSSSFITATLQKASENTWLCSQVLLVREAFSQAISEPFCLDMQQAVPTHPPCWVKGSFRSCCPNPPPPDLLELVFRLPIRFLLVFLLFYSLRYLVSDISLGIIPILTLLYLPPTLLPVWKTSILFSERINSGSDWLSNIHFWGPEAKYWLLCSVFCSN